MQIGQKLRELREAKEFSQGVIEKRTGLLRCYVSRVENGHTVPSVDTLEKWARALEVPLYKLFHDGEEPLPRQNAYLSARNHRSGAKAQKNGRNLYSSSRDSTNGRQEKRSPP